MSRTKEIARRGGKRRDKHAKLEPLSGQISTDRHKVTKKSSTGGHGASVSSNVVPTPSLPSLLDAAQKSAEAKKQSLPTRYILIQKFDLPQDPRYKPGNADAIIECGNHQLRVHKALLASRSSYFADAFESCSKQQDGFSVIAPEKRQFEIIRNLIDYIYNKSYSTLSGPPEYHLEMFLAATSYGVGEVKSSAQTGFAESLSLSDVTGLERSIRMTPFCFIYASSPSRNGLDLLGLVHCIYEVNTATTVNLRGALLRKIIEKLPFLVKDAHFQQQLQTVKGLAQDLVMLQGNPGFDGPWNVDFSTEPASVGAGAVGRASPEPLDRQTLKRAMETDDDEDEDDDEPGLI